MRMGREKFPELFLDSTKISPKVSDVNNFNYLFKDKKFRSFIEGALLESRSDVFKSLFDRNLFEPRVEDILITPLVM